MRKNTKLIADLAVAARGEYDPELDQAVTDAVDLIATRRAMTERTYTGGEVQWAQIILAGRSLMRDIRRSTSGGAALADAVSKKTKGAR